MRQITIEAVRAFVNGKDYNKSNTQVNCLLNSIVPYQDFYLHNNKIAEIKNSKLTLKTCGGGN